MKLRMMCWVGHIASMCVCEMRNYTLFLFETMTIRDPDLDEKITLKWVLSK